MKAPGDLPPDVSRETIERLNTYKALLLRWNKKINLVAPGTIEDAWRRHFLDSAQLVDLAGIPGHWADLGSGGGFPGMVAAIIMHERSPNTAFTLIESDQRKAVFLRTVARETAIPVSVKADRIESAPPAAADIVSARALAPLDALLGYCARHLADGGKALLLKGDSHLVEIEKAQKNWQFQVERIPSRTQENAVVLIIEGIARVE